LDNKRLVLNGFASGSLIRLLIPWVSLQRHGWHHTIDRRSRPLSKNIDIRYCNDSNFNKNKSSPKFYDL